MTIKIQGRYSEGNINLAQGEWTAEEITALIKDGYRGMISFTEFFGSYKIDGVEYSATALSVGDETFVYEQNGKIVVPTYFSSAMLANQGDRDLHERVAVDVIIDVEKHPIYITLVKR